MYLDVTTNPLVRTAQYLRISEDQAGLALGVARQAKETAELCERKGWAITGTYTDNNISASRYSRKQRPAYQQLLLDIEARKFDAVVFWDQDRLVRQPKELEEFISICERADLKLLASIGDSINVDTGEGLLVLRIKGAVAAEESRKTSARIKSKQRQLMEKGQLTGGNRTFGYSYSNNTLTIILDEAAHLREGAQRVLAGESIRSLAQSWNDHGVKTARGNTWAPTALARLLTSPLLIGTNKMGIKGDWEPILDQETHEALRALLADPKRRTNTIIRRYLLTGLVFCSSCRTKMVARPTVAKVRSYQCIRSPGSLSCGKRRVLAEPLEELISQAVTITLDSPELEKARLGKSAENRNLEVLRVKLKADRTSLEELSDDYYVQRIIDREGFFKARSALEGRIKSAEKQIAELQPANSQWDHKGSQLWEEWDSFSLGTKRAIIETIVERIWIHPARRGYNKFDRDRIFIDWSY